MKRIALLLVLVLLMAGCNEKVEKTKPNTDLSSSAVTDKNGNQYPDTWFDFSNQEPLFDDSGDADNYDIKRVFAANDKYYIYTAFEVEGETIDSTTMINGGECIFVTIDTPGFFMVSNVDKKVFADSNGNGDYIGSANYKYNGEILQIRIPVDIFEGCNEVIINTLFRETSNGIKNEADKCDDFKYSIK